MKLNLTLRKGKTTILFISPIKLKESKLKINRAKMIWSLYNVVDYKIHLDSDYTLPTGYYTFEDLKSFLEGKNCTVELEKSGKVSITPPSGKTLNLKSLGPLLGFNENQTFNSKQTSPYIVDINANLRNISIFCNRVNTYRNFDMGKRSEKLTSILVPSENLWGITSEHSLETETFLENGEMSSIEFLVKDDSFVTDKDSYILNLDCEKFHRIFFDFPMEIKKR